MHFLSPLMVKFYSLSRLKSLIIRLNTNLDVAVKVFVDVIHVDSRERALS